MWEQFWPSRPADSPVILMPMHTGTWKILNILPSLLLQMEWQAKNGGLELVEGNHLQAVPLGSDRCVEPSWAESHTWVLCDLQPGILLTFLPLLQKYSLFLGDIPVFGAYLAHRSGANHSKDRKAIYAAYNPASEGELHAQWSIICRLREAMVCHTLAQRGWIVCRGTRAISLRFADADNWWKDSSDCINYHRQRRSRIRVA